MFIPQTWKKIYIYMLISILSFTVYVEFKSNPYFCADYCWGRKEAHSVWKITIWATAQALSNRWRQIKPWFVCEMKFMCASSVPLLSSVAYPGLCLASRDKFVWVSDGVAYKRPMIKSELLRHHPPEMSRIGYTPANNSESKCSLVWKRQR